MQHGAFAVVRGSGEVQIEIFIQAAANGHVRSGLAGGEVEAAFGAQRAQVLTVLVDADVQDIPRIVFILAGFDIADGELICAEAHDLAFVHFDGLVDVEGFAGEADEHEHDAHVHQVAAVAAGIAMREFDHGGEDVLAFFAADGDGAFEEFDDDRDGDEGAEGEGH